MPSISLHNRAVLVVHNSAASQAFLKAEVENLGGTVEVAANGIEAIDKLLQQKSELVLMAVQLPDMDGVETTAYIRTRLQNNLPIIGLGTLKQATEKKKCLHAGMNYYLAAPFTEKQLHRVLQTAVDDMNQPADNPNLLTNGDVVVDVSMIYEVAGDDESYIEMMISTFLETVPVTLQKMEDALQQKNFETLYQMAHYSKSSFSVIKISDTITIVQSIEKKAKTQSDVDELPGLLQRVVSNFEIAKELLIKKFRVAV